MAVAVNIFNANSLNVNVNINSGAAFTILGTGASVNWTPQRPNVNVEFTGGPPAPGALGIGTNSVVMTPGAAATPFVAQINLPATVNWQSIQLYIFFQSYVSCSWALMNEGQIITYAAATALTQE
ncbi:MAG: hypothetical protein ACJ74H_04970 [Thermoanaerobaculia bacterium]